MILLFLLIAALAGAGAHYLMIQHSIMEYKTRIYEQEQIIRSFRGYHEQCKSNENKTTKSS